MTASIFAGIVFFAFGSVEAQDAKAALAAAPISDEELDKLLGSDPAPGQKSGSSSLDNVKDEHTKDSVAPSGDGQAPLKPGHIRYRVGDKVYNIPYSLTEKFIKDMPDAVRVRAGERDYQAELDEVLGNPGSKSDEVDVLGVIMVYAGWSLATILAATLLWFLGKVLYRVLFVLNTFVLMAYSWAKEKRKA